MMLVCKNCGSKIQMDYDDRIIFCHGCNEELEKSETLSEHRFEARIEQLKAMHTMMCYSNDEYIYGTWIITGVPDEPTQEDFEGIALDDELYNECFDLFVELVKSDGNRW